MSHPRVLMIIAPKDYRDEELSTPQEVFEDQGWIVDVVSTHAGEARGMLGSTTLVRRTVDDVNVDEYHIAVVVGGMGSIEYLWEHGRIHHILKHVAGKPDGVVGAICLSGAVLAKAGLLHGRQATVWNAPEAVEALKTAGATYTGAPVTVDANIVTANGPDAAEAFAQEVVKLAQAVAV